jgi:methylmalonyl-CoA mutase
VAGAEEIAFRDTEIENASDLELLLAGLGEVPLHFEEPDEHLIGMLTARQTKKTSSASISTGFDPHRNTDFAAEIVSAALERFVPFTIHGDVYEEWGATAVQEVGLTLAAGIDFVASMRAQGIKPDRVADSVAFSFAIENNFFIEIAKLRAFRMLWARALESFGASPQHSRALLYARASQWNQTIYDPHVNILRSTTEAMSAVLGGADSITVAPFDECYRSPTEASRRLARNTQLILKHEAHLDRVADPGGGSYFLESTTDSIAHEGWKLMQRVEAEGGYRKASGHCRIARILEESLAPREEAVESRRRVLTGTNRYADPSDRALDRIDASGSGTSRRAAQVYEELRLRTERHAAKTSKTPLILLAEFGDAKMRSSRSHFAADLFACAGLQTTTRPFNNSDEIAAAGADLIVLCSSDPEYLAFASKLLPKLRARESETPIIIAGLPEPTEQLLSIGIAGFVHLRTNPIEFLEKWQQRLGIEA